MKILRLTSSPAITPSPVQGEHQSSRALELHPDSALIPEGRPLFYPDLADSWQATFYLAIRISRLGKRISTRFASRYYDALALAVAITPTENEETPDGTDLATLTPSQGWLNVLDNSITHGPWQEPSLPLFDGITMEVTSTSDTTLPSATISAQGVDIDQAISLCSRFTTLRTGDILLLPLHASLPLLPRTRLVASSSLLNLKVV